MTAPGIEDLIAASDADLAARRTAVYRFYDETGRLLYVGITADLFSRWRWHEKNATWWPDQQRIEVVWHDNRASADGEETLAIDVESPVHNSAKRGKTPQKSFRLDDDAWGRLGAGAAAIGRDRTAVLKDLIDWFNCEPGAQLPERPPRD